MLMGACRLQWSEGSNAVWQGTRSQVLHIILFHAVLECAGHVTWWGGWWLRSDLSWIAAQVSEVTSSERSWDEENEQSIITTIRQCRITDGSQHYRFYLVSFCFVRSLNNYLPKKISLNCVPCLRNRSNSTWLSSTSSRKLLTVMVCKGLILFWWIFFMLRHRLNVTPVFAL